MYGENQYYCNKCRSMADTMYGNKIYTLSNILVIILNRGRNNMNKIVIDFPLEIDLSDYVLSSINNEKNTFSLYGVIFYMEDCHKEMHFIATCKSPIDGKWFRYKDENVTPISDLNKEVLNFNTPYILFYERKNKN